MDWDDYKPLEDYEYPDEPEENEDDSYDDVYVTCAECGGDVYEDADSCPACGHFMLAAEREGLPQHWKILAALIVIGMLIGALSALR